MTDLSPRVKAAIKKYGSYEAYQKVMRERASKGGKVKVPKGFAANRKLASEAGKKGGSRTKKDFEKNKS